MPEMMPPAISRAPKILIVFDRRFILLTGSHAWSYCQPGFLESQPGNTRSP
jgi:hypothetical protein